MSFLARRVILVVWLAVFLAGWGHAHVINQLYAEWAEDDGGWRLEVQFEGGFADAAIREDPVAAAPTREWLMGQGEAGWEKLRTEAERYLRESLRISDGEKKIDWAVEFPDFRKSPPDFPELLNDGAYFRLVVIPREVSGGPVTLDWATGESRPTLILKLPEAEGGYLTFEPGDRKEIEISAKPSGAVWTSFRQGFLHVVPKGWDHVLFVMGLFFYRRKWRPLLEQSLAFTVAHTVTLGLAASGVVRVSGNWVEPVIALSLVAVALENLRSEKEAGRWGRLAVVFGFGLIHGLGFAGALSVWLRPGEGVLPSLLSANLGVEAAQAALLGAAWLLTMGWNETAAYRWVRLAVCLGIAGVGMYWAIERVL